MTVGRDSASAAAGIGAIGILVDEIHISSIESSSGFVNKICHIRLFLAAEHTLRPVAVEHSHWGTHFRDLFSSQKRGNDLIIFK